MIVQGNGDGGGAALDRLLAQAQRDGRLPSVAASVSRRGVLLWTGGAGVVTGPGGDGRSPTPDTQYRIGSITKSMVAVAVLRLVDEGVLALDDPVAAHLPGGDVLGRVRVEQLLTHSGGLPSETSGPWWERIVGADWPALLADLAQRPSVLRPGQQFHYSNPGFAVLGALLGHARGTDWFTAVSADVLGPLGMTRTTYHPTAPHAPGLAVHPHADVVLSEPSEDGGAMAPAGQLWSTTDDLVRWAAFLAGSGTAQAGTAPAGDAQVGTALLRPSTMTMLRTPLAVDDRPGQPWTTAWGLGVSVHNLDGRRLVGHGGSMPGFLATVLVDPDDGTAVTVLANATHGLPPSLATDLLAAGEDEHPAPVAAWGATDQREVLGLVGVWYWGSRAQRVTAQRLPDGTTGLHLAPLDGPGRVSRFVPAGDGWLGRDAYYAGERLTVVRRPDGSIDHLDLGSFVLTRTPYDPAADIPGGLDPDGWRA